VPEALRGARPPSALSPVRWPLVVVLSLAVHLAAWAMLERAWQAVHAASPPAPAAPAVQLRLVAAAPRIPPPAPPQPQPPEPPPPEPPTERPPPPARPQTPPPPAKRPEPPPKKRTVHKPRPPAPRPRPAPPKPPAPPPVVAAPAAAPAPPEAAEPVAAAPAPLPQHRIDAYLARLQALIRKRLHYPARARRRGLEGEVLLDLEIAPDGTIQAVQVHRGSGHRALDRAAVRTLRAIANAGPPPGERTGPLALQVPIRFRLRP